MTLGDGQRRLELLVERTARLHRLTAQMSRSLSEAEIAQIVIDESADSLGAHSAGLWRLDGSELVLVGTKNYPDAALALVRRMLVEPGRPITDAVLRGEPVFLQSRAEYEQHYPESSARMKPMSPKMYAIAALPIMFRDHALGVIALTFGDEHRFDDDERGFLMTLSLHCAQGFERARLYAQQTQARERAEFLARASALLGSSLDYEETLRNVAAIAVPRIGDWCGVDLVDRNGQLKQVAVAHVDPAKVELAHELRRRYPPDASARSGVPNVLRTGRSELYAEITDEMLVAGSRDDEHLRISRELGLRSAMVVPIKDRGAVVGAISFVVADSPRRYSDEDVMMAEQLAERAGAAIGNAMLYAEAQAAVRLRDDFLSIAGHELRTPLAALTLHHQTLIQTRDGTPADSIRERGRKLLMQTDRLTRLIEHVLDVTRITSGRLALDLETFDLAIVVREVVDRLRDDLERANCELTLDATEVIGRWDRSRIDQIAMNLLSNAIKYGKGKPILVHVGGDASVARLRVTDHGIGIAAEHHQRIFERFERAVPVRNFGGLGLGLWITRQLVEAHDGTVSVESAPDAGASFTVTLPIHTGGALP